MDYLFVKHLHMSCAALSGSFFLLRGLWMLADAPILQKRWVKNLPHFIDSALLASAIALALWSAQYPFVQRWLTAKIVALIAYIVLGSVALKYGPSKRIRTIAYIGALTIFAYIVGVAMTKNAVFFLSALPWTGV